MNSSSVEARQYCARDEPGDAQHLGRRGREGDAVVARFPHEAHAERTRRGAAHVPGLPVHDRLAGERGRGRDPRRAADDERRDDKPADEGPHGPRTEHERDREGARERERSDRDCGVVEQCRGPTGTRDRDCGCGERLPRCDEQCDRRHEAEDGEREHTVHLRAPRRVERQEDVVVVPHARAESVEERGEHTLVAVGQQLPTAARRTRPTPPPRARGREARPGPQPSARARARSRVPRRAGALPPAAGPRGGPTTPRSRRTGAPRQRSSGPRR